MDYLKNNKHSGFFSSTTPEEQGMDSSRLLQMCEHLDAANEDIRSILIIRNGHAVFEAYYYPYQYQTRHALNSATKAFTSALIGIAIDKGYIPSAQTKVLDLFPEYRFQHTDARKKAMTIQHLLSMTSGLNWSQSMHGEAPENEMFQHKDPVQFILDQPMDSKPGTVFNYSGGASHLLSALIQKTTGQSTFDFATEHLFTPLDMSDLSWDRHGSSRTAIGCAGIYMRPRDMAKFGYLYLNRGQWKGRTILSPEWIEESRKKRSDQDYGYKWWLLPELNISSAWGSGGQRIAVLPDQNMVVVFTGGLADNSVYPFHPTLYRDYIIPSVKSSQALPTNPDAYDQLTNWIARIGKNPKSQPPHALPTTARTISGKKYVLEPNAFLFSWFLLEFTTETKTATIHCEIYGIKGKFSLGLDGVFRKKTVTSNKRSLAFKGHWADKQTLTLDVLLIDLGYRYRFEMRFRGDGVEIHGVSSFFRLDVQLQGKQQ